MMTHPQPSTFPASAPEKTGVAWNPEKNLRMAGVPAPSPLQDASWPPGRRPHSTKSSGRILGEKGFSSRFLPIFVKMTPSVPAHRLPGFKHLSQSPFRRRFSQSGIDALAESQAGI